VPVYTEFYQVFGKRASGTAQPRQHRAKRTSADGLSRGGQEPVESPGMIPRAGRASCKSPMQKRSGTPAGVRPAGVGYTVVGGGGLPAFAFAFASLFFSAAESSELSSDPSTVKSGRFPPLVSFCT
jgi:hypothetical protein